MASVPQAVELLGGWEVLFSKLRDFISDVSVPSVSLIAQTGREPYRVLVSTLISLRTKDALTIEASRRLFASAPDMKTLSTLEEKEIADLIYPAGFYRVKAQRLKEIARRLAEKGVPSSRKELLDLPGVGRKTANLVLGLAFSVPAICVDIHVHRISNRMGFIRTKTPEQSEEALEAILPQVYWIEINSDLVAFGQSTCTPTSPHCSRCPFSTACPKNGVERSR